MVPEISLKEAEKVAEKLYGFNRIQRIQELGSCQDANFRLDVEQTKDSTVRSYVLKISNLSTSLNAIQFQNIVLNALVEAEKRTENLQFPSLVPNVNKEFTSTWSIGSDTYFVRCYTFVNGIVLSDCKYLTLDVCEQLGAVAYRISNHLNTVDFSDAYALLSEEHGTQWDMQYAFRNMERYVSMLVPTPTLDVPIIHSMLRQAYHMQLVIEKYIPYLSKQVIHGDLAYYNFIAEAADKVSPLSGGSNSPIYGRPKITGVIDFCDCTYSWLVGELCAAITPLLAIEDHDLVEVACAVLRGFLSAAASGTTAALSDSEVLVLWPLIVQRAIMLNIFVAYQLQVDPTNEYCTKEIVLNRRLLERVTAVPLVYAQTSLHHVLLSLTRPDVLASPPRLPRPMITLEGLTSLVYLDMSTTSTVFQEKFWHENVDKSKSKIGECVYDLAAVTNKVWMSLTSEGISTKKSASGIILSYGAPQFYRTLPLSRSLPRTVPLGTTILLNQALMPAIWLKLRCNGSMCTVPTLKLNSTSSSNAASPLDPFLEGPLSKAEIRLIRLDNCPYDVLLRTESKSTLVEKFSRPSKIPRVDSNSDVSWDFLEEGDKIIIKAHAAGALGCPVVHVQMVSRSLAEVLVDSAGTPELPPLYCSATEYDAWRTLCPDPSLFLQLPNTRYRYDGAFYKASECGFGVPSESDYDSVTSLLAKAEESFRSRKNNAASAQEYYFADLKTPPFIERGFKQYLIDVTGRTYLDMVNNVALVGHSRSAVTLAVQRQLSVLNTNSRFVYSALGEFCDQVVSKLNHVLPNRWSTVSGWSAADSKSSTESASAEGVVDNNRWQVFVVNSGSEAIDLALRLARTVVTERRRHLASKKNAKNASLPYELERHTLCFGGGYHGVTTTSDEVSTTLNDNPRSRESRPSWIHLLPLPNMYRGQWRSAAYGKRVANADSSKKEFLSLGQKYAETVDVKLAELEKAGKTPSAFVCEPLVGNAGSVELPPGYLQRVYTAVRAKGGLCICDEVQVGYGRLGRHFWGFEEHGVVPDIITMAKAAGNGHPLGFVVTSRDIAEAFREAESSFFSSSGGCPTSCVTGTEVLRLLERERLPENAHIVGEYLRGRLLDLQARYAHIIGCIHGHGLYQGVELVSEGSPDCPAPSGMVKAICNRLLSLGVICHGTGDYSNILKVKPPLCFSRSDADFFVSALETVISTGW